MSAGLVARYTGGFTWTESWVIGFGMPGRTRPVVTDIACTEHGIINDAMFHTLMFTAFCLNIAVPLTTRWRKPRFSAEISPRS